MCSTGPHLPGQQPGDTDLVSEIPAISSTHSPIDDVFSNVLSPTKLNLVPSSNTTGVVAKSPTVQNFEADQVLHERSSGPILACRNSFEQHTPLDINLSISVALSFLPPTIPPEPLTPLLFLGDKRLQVQISDTSATDLDMISYVLE